MLSDKGQLAFETKVWSLKCSLGPEVRAQFKKKKKSKKESVGAGWKAEKKRVNVIPWCHGLC